MTCHGGLFRACSLLGNYRNILNIRCTLPIFQQDVRCKSVNPEKLGLPPRPKRPLTPYFKFMQQVRPSIKDKNPGASVIDITKLVALHWERVDPTVKQELEIEYKKEQAVYLQAKLKWDSQLSKEDKDAMLQYKKDQELSKEKRERRKKIKEYQKPTKAPTAFVLFMQKMIKSRGDVPFKEWQLKQSEIWNKMSNEEKKPYVDQSKVLSDKYKEELAIWEEKMIRIGNIDLVRNESLIEPRQMKKRPAPKQKNE